MAEYSSRRKRKIYALGRSQPSRPTFVTLNGHVEYFDAARMAVDYSFYDILPSITGSGIPPALYEYEENVVNFVKEVTKTVTYASPFHVIPVVTVEPIAASSPSLSNISASLDIISGVTNFTVRLSAPYTGQLLYRAVRALYWPMTVARAPVSASALYSMEAGTREISNRSDVLITYSSFTTAPSNMFLTVVDYFGNQQSSVGIVSVGPYGATSTPVSFSSNVTGRINYMIVK